MNYENWLKLSKTKKAIKIFLADLKEYKKDLLAEKQLKLF